MTATDQGFIDYKVELLRKGIHLCSLSIPIIYYFITRELALQILIPLVIFSLVVDIGRYYIPPLSKIFYKFFGFMLRKHETDDKKKTLNGATYVLLAALIMVFFFPKIIVIHAIAVLIIGDMTAALIGRKFGRTKFLAKSLEGTLAFFFASIFVVLAAPKIEGHLLEYVIGIIAVAVAAIAENISYGWADDNLTIPLSVGLVMWGLYYLLFPGLELILPNVPV